MQPKHTIHQTPNHRGRSNDSLSLKSILLAVFGWLLYLATFPAGIEAGYQTVQGQDAAGRGIGFALGVLVCGLFGGILASVFVSYSMIRLKNHPVCKILAGLPWIILPSYYWLVLFTPLGDYLVKCLHGS